MPNPLEYLEEDSPPFSEQAEAGPSRSPAHRNVARSEPLYPAITEGSRHSRNLGDRLELLRLRKMEGRVREWREKGVESLGVFCLEVIKQNASRIWDIGDLRYPQVQSFLNDLPMAQLSEIETHSPHIRKETDWLWEIFLIQDYPLYYEKCAEKSGEQRTSGWRRMYAKAKEDTSNRRLSAADKIKERYRQLDEERNSRKIVVMDRLQPGKPPAKRRGASAPAARSSSTGIKLGVIAKARQETLRARTAMLHASGHYKPPPPQVKRTSHDPEAIFKVRPPVSSVTIPSVDGPRIPPPRSLSRHIAGSITRKRSAPDSYPAARNPTSNSITSVGTQKSATERFRIPEAVARKVVPIQKPVVENFEAPKEKRKFVDFFDIPQSASASSVKRTRVWDPVSPSLEATIRRPTQESVLKARPNEPQGPPSTTTSSLNRKSELAVLRPPAIDMTALPTSPPPLAVPTRVVESPKKKIESPAEERARLSALLFRKKKK